MEIYNEESRKELAKLNHALYVAVTLPLGDEKVFSTLDRKEGRAESLKYIDSDEAVNFMSALTDEQEEELRELLKEEATGDEEPLIIEVNENNFLIIATLPEYNLTSTLRVSEAAISPETVKKIDEIHEALLTDKDTKEKAHLLESISYLESLLGITTEELETLDLPALQAKFAEIKTATEAKLKSNENTPVSALSTESPLLNSKEQENKGSLLEDPGQMFLRVIKEKKEVSKL